MKMRGSRSHLSAYIGAGGRVRAAQPVRADISRENSSFYGKEKLAHLYNDVSESFVVIMSL